MKREYCSGSGAATGAVQSSVIDTVAQDGADTAFVIFKIH